MSKSESPIEEMFLQALRRVRLDEPCLYKVVAHNDCDGSIAFEDGSEIVVMQQAPLGPYRLDFYLIGLAGRPLGICFAVEIDGHDWHDRTKEQAASDRRRDRHLLRSGIATIRFTGSEVYADAAACARETIQDMLGFRSIRSALEDTLAAIDEKPTEYGRT